jgi:hypothetical protein
LEGRLFWREQNQRGTVGIVEEGLANFLQAQERFSRAGGTEKKSRLHAIFVAQKKGWVKEEGSGNANWRCCPSCPPYGSWRRMELVGSGSKNPT